MAVVTSLALVGCNRGPDPATQLPDGWNQSGNRWWLEGADTTAAFRSLDDLHAMGVQSDVVYASTRELAAQPSLQRDQLVEAVRRTLVRLYRNEPEIVDSLFERVAAPLLADVPLQGDPDELVERNKKRAYDAVRRHFREPAPRMRLGEDVEVVYPDSLRKRDVGGAVRMQVRVNDAGEPIAIQLLQGVHPTLDRIAMNATSRMRWEPAYLLRKNEWQKIPSWARFNIHFGVPGTSD